MRRLSTKEFNRERWQQRQGITQVKVMSLPSSRLWSFDTTDQANSPKGHAVQAKRCVQVLTFAPLMHETPQETATRERENLRQIKTAFRKVWKQSSYLKFDLTFSDTTCRIGFYENLGNELALIWRTQMLLSGQQSSDVSVSRHKKKSWNVLEISRSAANMYDLIECISRLEKCFSRAVSSQPNLYPVFRDQRFQFFFGLTSAPTG